MINNVLQRLQEQSITLEAAEVELIIERTMCLLKFFVVRENRDYLVDACIPYAIDNWDKLESKIEEIIGDGVILETLIKSPATTSNVNKRFQRIKEIIEG